MLELLRAVFAPPRDLILLVAAGWAGLALAEKRAQQSAISEKTLDTLVGAAAVAFVIGGRLLYAAEHLSAFAGSPLSILSLNTSALDIWAGLATAVVVAAVLMQRKGLPSWRTLDVLAPLLAALAIGVALSHLETGAAFGKETGLAWAINEWGAERHPTQLYELIAAVAALAIVWYQGGKNPGAGRPFLLWMALASASRLLIEGFRGDSTLVFGGLRLAQIISWAVLAASLVGLELRSRQAPQEVHERSDDGAGMTPHRNRPRADKKQRAVPRRNSAP